MVERSVIERERERIRLGQRCLDASSLKVSSRERELFRLEVDAEQLHAWELLTEDRQHRADPAADLEQARSRASSSSPRGSAGVANARLVPRAAPGRACRIRERSRSRRAG